MTSTSLKPLRIEPRPEFADILRDEPFAASTRGSQRPASGSGERINRAFDRLIFQSGTHQSGPVVLRLCLLAALAFGGLAFVFSENLLATGLATGVGALLPVAELALRRARRRARLSEQFPAVVEQLLRAARAGRGLETNFEQIAARTPAPLGDELRLALRRTQLGLGLGEALQELPERTGLPGTCVLVTAVRLAERHGGDPAECLKLLSASLQERAKQSRQRLEATALDWAAGVLVFLLQALVVWLFVVADPQQVSRMAASRASLAMAAAAGAILIAGWYCLLRLSAARRSVT
jgi:Flp pilus assembly protein TadB